MQEICHAAFEINDARLSDPTAVINPTKYTEYVTVASSRAGIQCGASVHRTEANGNIGVYGHLRGYRGDGEVYITLLGFKGEEVVSKNINTSKCTWTKDTGWGKGNLISSAELLSKGYVTRDDPTAHILITYHLKMS